MHVPSPDVLLSLRDIVREKKTVREGVLTRPEVEAEPLPDTVPPAPPSLPGLICWLSLCWLSLCWLSLCWLSLCWLLRLAQSFRSRLSLSRSLLWAPLPSNPPVLGIIPAQAVGFILPLRHPRFPSLTEAFIDRPMFRDPFDRAHCSLISDARLEPLREAHRGARVPRLLRLDTAAVSLKLLGVSRRMAPLTGLPEVGPQA